MESQYILSDKTGSKRFIRRRLLGTGGFAKCYEVVNTLDGQVYAAKVIPKKNIIQKRQRYKLLLQIKLHRSLPHENIVGFRDVFEDSENIYIILEYCRNSTLKDLVKRRRRLTEYETRVYLLQMVKALIFIHSNNIIHRDLKLGNILINDNMQLKLCDFGLSTRIKDKREKKKTVCGTPNYIAPEILEELGHSYQADIWSLGVIIFTLLTGKPPYEQNSVQSTYLNIRNNKYSFPQLGLSESAKDLVEKILVLDPYQRLTLQQILKHEFLQPLQSIPLTLPAYTLAIPPQNVDDRRLHPLKNLSIDYVYSEQVVSQHFPMVDKSIIIKQSQNEDEENSIDELDFSGKRVKQTRQTKTNLQVYIRDSVISGDDLGLLYSNGIMGVFFAKDKSNIIMEYDEKYFVFVQLTNDKVVTEKYNVGILDEKIKDKYQKATYFINFFKFKYYNDMFDMMRKRYEGKDLQLIYVKKIILLKEQTLIRMSNGIVQMQFKDLTSLFMNRNQDDELYFIDRQGKEDAYRYSRIQAIRSEKTRKKIRKFSRVLEEIWNRAQQ